MEMMRIGRMMSSLPAPGEGRPLSHGVVAAGARGGGSVARRGGAAEIGRAAPGGWDPCVGTASSGILRVRRERRGTLSEPGGGDEALADDGGLEAVRAGGGLELLRSGTWLE
jgi:hypothetical protein